MKSAAVVTGCAGFIGSCLVDNLLKDKISVIGIDNLRSGRIENLSSALEHSDFNFYNLDVCNNDLDEVSVHSADTIFHLAAISSVKLSVENPKLVHCANVTGTLNVLELARRIGATRVVFTSSAAVYGKPERMPVTEETSLTPLSPYAASKIAAEEYLRAYGNAFELEPVILRLFNVYGPRQSFSEYSGVISIFINQALRNEEIRIEGDGLQTRSFVHVDDVVKALIQAAKAPDAVMENINISSCDSISILDLARRIQNSIS
ncbi:MAG: NAD-dependent epimerase/dehydratase family protein, partial [Candidatus Hodarchaeota archaeon]